MCPGIFWKKVDKINGPIPKSCPERGQCWLWTGCTNHAGYGVTSVAAKFKAAHRLAYEYEIGEIPDGLKVCHHCDVPNCCRPSHFFLGTDADNAADRDSKGRQSRGDNHSAAITPNRPKGSANAMSKFTEEQVAEMRRLRKETNMTIKDIANQFGASYGGAHKAIRGEGWNHIAEQPAPAKPFSKHPKEIVDAVRAARASGAIIKKIAQDFGFSVNTVNNMIYGNNRGQRAPG